MNQIGNGKQITVFGASGKVGTRVVELALERGYTVVAFVHSHDLFVPSNQLIVKKGDIYNEADCKMALQGSGAVISCLGSWGTKHKNVLTTAMRAIIPAMQQQNTTRIVTLTGSGAVSPDTEISKGHDVFMKLLMPFPAGKVFADGETHMRLLAASSLNWTSLRSPVMNNFGPSQYALSLKPSSPVATINRQAVATAILDQLDSTDFIAQAPILHRT